MQPLHTNRPFSLDPAKRRSHTAKIWPSWGRNPIDSLTHIFLIGVSAILHFWRITSPNEFVFDEVYFPVYAQNYLQETAFFDAHPPLGKYLIAVGIRFFGFNPLGYRVMDALFGIGVVVLTYRIGKLLFASRRIGFIAGFLAMLDGLLLVESRAGLINIFAVFFSLAAYYLFLKSGRGRVDKPRWVYLLGAGICIGAAAAVKWVGAASAGVILIVYLMAYLKNRWRRIQRFLPANALVGRIGKFHPGMILVCCIMLPLLVYSVTFIPHLQQNPEYSFLELHKQMFGYHAHLEQPHGYASPWWSWPLLLRPVSYFWNVNETTQEVSTILNIGNPALWWLAIPAVAMAIWFAFFRRTFGAQFALLAIALHYLPFAFISRATFLYHFMGALPFTVILLSFALDKLWQAKGLGRELAAVAVLTILLCAVYFYPLWTGLPIPVGAFYQRMWLISWI